MASAIRWLELAVPASAEAVEAVSEILDRVAFNGIAIEEPAGDGWGAGPQRPSDVADHLVKAYIPDDGESAARLERVREALGHLQAFGLGPIGEPSVRAIDDADWLEAWKAAFTPIRIGAFLVRPTWSDASADGDAIALVLDPGMAFGTGLHPTTQACLETLSTLPLRGRSVLDVGCGSGLLAIGAAKRGARPVVAVDVDPLAVDAARENAKGNGVAVEVRRGSAADVGGRYDVVVANIVAPVLRAIAADLRARLRPGGALLLAGIVAEAEAETLAAFGALGLVPLSRDQRGDWVSCVLGERAAP